jgi:hypothetical protein
LGRHNFTAITLEGKETDCPAISEKKPQTGHRNPFEAIFGTFLKDHFMASSRRLKVDVVF